ncbi:MAG TPA: hypothetical protein VKE22_06945 [Haliangiales bacterium]|nr:hypothetical protein [Haliangiales bacterium]
MTEGPLQREVGARARWGMRAALVACAMMSAASLGISLAGLRARAHVVAVPAARLPETFRDTCGGPVVLRATVARASFAAEPRDAVARASRIVPAMWGGRMRGVKIYAIRPGSLPAMIGLRNGDTLLRIQDVDLVAPDALLEATRRIRDAGLVTIVLERRGCPMVLLVSVS